MRLVHNGLLMASLAAVLFAGTAAAEAHPSERATTNGRATWTEAQEGHRGGPCTGKRGWVTRQMPLAEQQHKVRWLIACAVLQWPVPGGLQHALYIAERESGLWPYAYNPSGCSGVYQWARGTWEHLIRSWPVMNAWTGTSVWNARGNVLRAIRSAHETGWGPWGG